MNKNKALKLKEKYTKKSKQLLDPENRKSLVYLVGISFSLIFIVSVSIATRVPPKQEIVEEVKKEEVLAASVDPTVVTVSTKEPSEEIPKEEEYIVDADMPRTIGIPSIGINGFVQQVGVDQDNKIAVPNNIHMVGWYINSVKPGDEGLSIIDGHVDGQYTGGVFYDLQNITIGDEYKITYGDGTEVNLRVVDKIQVNVNDSADVLFAKRPEISNQLNLITCVGTFIPEAESYDQRLIVISEKI